MENLVTLSTALGVLVLVAVTADLVVTTLVPSGGAGFLTRWSSGLMWRVLGVIHGRLRSHRALRAAGPLIVAVIIVMWLVGLVAGWALVFGREGAVVTTEDGTPIPTLGRVYYAAAMVLGAGGGTSVPGSDVWQAVQQVAAGTGVMFIGLSIAYVIPIVNSVVHKREVASYISSLGGSPDEILVRAFDEEAGFGSLHLHLIALTPMVNRLAQNHLAYPVLHYFHSGERFTALGPSIVVLDETLTLAEEGLVEEHYMDPSSVRPCRAAIDGFLQSLTRVAVVAADEPLPRPSLDVYRETKLPMRPDEEIDERYGTLRERRCLLAGFLRHDGWEPDEVAAHVG